MIKHMLSSLALICCLLLHADVVWQIDFTHATAEEQKEWKLNGDCSFTPEGFVTDTVESDKAHAVAVSKTCRKGYPDGIDGMVCRATWSFVPDKIGGWGNDFRIGGAMVVEICNGKPILNAKHHARNNLQEGKLCTMSCDFSRYLLTSWKIDGVEQLEHSVPVWQASAGKFQVSLSDFSDTHSRTTWKAVTVEMVQGRDLRHLKTAARHSLSHPKPDVCPDFHLGQAGPMVKIFREASVYAGTFSRAVTVKAAGRERESFQLVIFPQGKTVRNVTVEVSDLMDSEGDQPDFSAKNISVYKVGYVRTREESSPRGGWQWPDVLLPYEPFDVEPGFVQPVWFTVDVPHGTPAGTYFGMITFKAEGMQPQVATLELVVRPFSLPLRGKLKTAFCLCPGMWEIWYKPDEVKKRLNMQDTTSHGVLYTSYECEDVLPHEKWLQMYDFLLAHRLSPTVIYSGLKKGRTRVIPAMADMQYCYDRGMNATCLACVSSISKDEGKAEKYLSELHAWLKQWEAFVKEKNWSDFTWYIHSYDETEMQKDKKEYFDYCIPRTHRYLAQHFPWLKRETANPYIPRFSDCFDIWTPLTSQLTEQKAPEYQKARDDGQEVWAYVCCGPGRPYANFFIDFDAACSRILPWQFYQQNVTGFLYYLMNYFEGCENWNMNAAKWPDVPWNCVRLNTNSDGILFYPGPDATPLPSTRLENLRDGIEDYEALAMLADLCKALKPANDADKALLATARQLLAVPSELSQSWKTYTKDPAIIVSTRAKVDDMIVKLQRRR